MKRKLPRRSWWFSRLKRKEPLLLSRRRLMIDRSSFRSRSTNKSCLRMKLLSKRKDITSSRSSMKFMRLRKKKNLKFKHKSGK